MAIEDLHLPPMGQREGRIGRHGGPLWRGHGHGSFHRSGGLLGSGVVHRSSSSGPERGRGAGHRAHRLEALLVAPRARASGGCVAARRVGRPPSPRCTSGRAASRGRRRAGGRARRTRGRRARAPPSARRSPVRFGSATLARAARRDIGCGPCAWRSMRTWRFILLIERSCQTAARTRRCAARTGSNASTMPSMTGSGSAPAGERTASAASRWSSTVVLVIRTIMPTIRK